MGKHRISKANQKIYFAGFYLEAIENVEKDEQLLNRKAMLAAHRESCLYHLVCAYEGLIWEVANTYDIQFASGQSLERVLADAHAGGKSSAELEQLFALETAQDSWLNRMLSVWRRQQDVDPATTSVPKSPVNLNAIEVRVSMEEDELLQLPDWHDKLRGLIEEIRQRLGEW